MDYNHKFNNTELSETFICVANVLFFVNYSNYNIQQR